MPRVVVRSFVGLASLLAVLGGCSAGSSLPRPPVDTLRALVTERADGWWLGVEHDPVWYDSLRSRWSVSRDLTAIELRAEWHDPAREAFRQDAEHVNAMLMITGIAIVLPPLLLGNLVAMPDASCRAVIALPEHDGRDLRVAADWNGPGGTAQVVMYAEHGQPLGVAPCLDGSRPVTRLPSTGTASDAAFAAGD